MCASYYTIWILLLDWLARGMYTITLVLCAEVEVSKSAIYAGNSVYLGNRVASQKKCRSQKKNNRKKRRKWMKGKP